MSCKDPRAVRLDYCQYGAKYRKRTRFMTNNPFRGRKCRKACSSISNGKHMEVASSSSDRKGAPQGKKGHTLDELLTYPDAITAKILYHVHKASPRERHGPIRPEPKLTPLRN